MNNIANVVVRTSFSSVMLIVKYNDEVIFRGITSIPKIKINMEYVYKNYKLLQECKNDGHCRDLLSLIDNLYQILKYYNVSKVKLNVAGPNRNFLYYILKDLGLEIYSIYDATRIPHNGCKPCIRERKKDY